MSAGSDELTFRGPRKVNSGRARRGGATTEKNPNVYAGNSGIFTFPSIFVGNAENLRHVLLVASRQRKNRNQPTMKIINLTPHPLTLVGDNGTLEVPPSGQIARLAVTRTALSPVTIDGVTLPVSRPSWGEITGLPAPEPGVIFVVSALVAEAANRGDVMSPGELLRDGAGNVIGARGLCAYREGGAE